MIKRFLCVLRGHQWARSRLYTETSILVSWTCCCCGEHLSDEVHRDSLKDMVDDLIMTGFTVMEKGNGS